MMTLQEMKSRKTELGYTNEMIAEKSGVPLGTVQKIFSGITAAPRYETLKKLETVLKEKQDEKTAFRYPEAGNLKGSLQMRDASAAHAVEKRAYTIEDYFALPDDVRAELIDGKFFYMESPGVIHQEISAMIHFELTDYIRSHHGHCRALAAPCAVRLDMDERTMVEPDVMVICDRDRISRTNIEGAPDLIIEILSPSTKKKDMTVKYSKYANAGVREYWLVDPDGRRVIVYNYEKDLVPVLYSFDQKVPVGIWEGKLAIDFAKISRELAYLFEKEDG